jgi:hypothetical protein
LRDRDRDPGGPHGSPSSPSTASWGRSPTDHTPHPARQPHHVTHAPLGSHAHDREVGGPSWQRAHSRAHCRLRAPRTGTAPRPAVHSGAEPPRAPQGLTRVTSTRAHGPPLQTPSDGGHPAGSKASGHPPAHGRRHAAHAPQGSRARDSDLPLPGEQPCSPALLRQHRNQVVSAQITTTPKESDRGVGAPPHAHTSGACASRMGAWGRARAAGVRRGGGAKINVLAVASHGHRRSCSDTQRHRENATGGYKK